MAKWVCYGCGVWVGCGYGAGVVRSVKCVPPQEAVRLLLVCEPGGQVRVVPSVPPQIPAEQSEDAGNVCPGRCIRDDHSTSGHTALRVTDAPAASAPDGVGRQLLSQGVLLWSYCLQCLNLRCCIFTFTFFFVSFKEIFLRSVGLCKEVIQTVFDWKDVRGRGATIFSSTYQFHQPFIELR